VSQHRSFKGANGHRLYRTQPNFLAYPRNYSQSFHANVNIADTIHSAYLVLCDVYITYLLTYL